MKPRSDLLAPIPPELVQADDLLHRFGRWALSRRGRQRCGSAEGRYQAPANDDDRVPREILQADWDAMRVQRALSKVDLPHRMVLEIVYVPRWISMHAALRLLGIKPAECQRRHLGGLRQFWGYWDV